MSSASVFDEWAEQDSSLNQFFFQDMNFPSSELFLILDLNFLSFNLYLNADNFYVSKPKDRNVFLGINTTQNLNLEARKDGRKEGRNEKLTL